MRKIDALLDQYSSDHQNRSNQRIHLLCVPLIVWSVAALLWAIPVPNAFLQPGAFCGLAMFLAWAYYWQLSHKLAMGMLVGFLTIGLLNHWIAKAYSMQTLFHVAMGIFIIAWIGQFIGHKIEGKRPSFFTDLIYLLIGPLWTLRKLYSRIGLGY